MTLETRLKHPTTVSRLSSGPLTPAIIREYNRLRGEDRGPFNGQRASASNPVMRDVSHWLGAYLDWSLQLISGRFQIEQANIWNRHCHYQAALMTSQPKLFGLSGSFSQSDIRAIISAPYLFGVVTFVLFAVATPNKYGDLLFESRVTSHRLRECEESLASLIQTNRIGFEVGSCIYVAIQTL